MSRPNSKTETITGGRPGQRRARVVGAVRAVSVGQDQPARKQFIYATGAIGRRGSTRAGTSTWRWGRRSAQARHGHRGSTWPRSTISAISGPSSTRRARSNSRAIAFAALAVCDAAVLVCEPSPERVMALTPLLEVHRRPATSPTSSSCNKIDSAEVRARDMLSALQSISSAQAAAAPGADPPCRRRRQRGDRGLCRPRERAAPTATSRAAPRT